jgi:2-polyprenyl-6-methoxyphenol hydroxylase-like FAD-dependent oxidoreductase
MVLIFECLPRWAQGAASGELHSDLIEHAKGHIWHTSCERRDNAVSLPRSLVAYRVRMKGIHVVAAEDLGEEGVRLSFSNATSVTADLVVGADGIKSIVRDSAWPDYDLKFTGIDLAGLATLE